MTFNISHDTTHNRYNPIPPGIQRNNTDKKKNIKQWEEETTKILCKF